MQELIVLLPVLLPVAFWAVYHYQKDRLLPEPVSMLLLAFVLGMLAVGVSMLLYRALGWMGWRFDAGALADSTPLGLLAYAMLVIGPVEEFSKLLPFALVIMRSRYLDEQVDGIVYASFIGLGYAAVENWQYLNFLTTVEAYARGFASPVVHMVFASIWGLWMTRAHLGKRSVLAAGIKGLLVAAGLHGVYDFLVILSPRNALPLAAAVILGAWVWRLAVLDRLARETRQDP
jgi:RsiW-degrading membrane proteinase PrsW (M82 family)